MCGRSSLNYHGQLLSLYSIKAILLNLEHDPMASSQNLDNQPLSPIETPLIALIITTQINEKITSSTFSQWRTQFKAFLIGYDLMDYATDRSVYPSSDGTPRSALIMTH